jgi:hypothetical protein
MLMSPGPERDTLFGEGLARGPHMSTPEFIDAAVEFTATEIRATSTER